jgi:hypothetical protein
MLDILRILQDYSVLSYMAIECGVSSCVLETNALAMGVGCHRTLACATVFIYLRLFSAFLL